MDFSLPASVKKRLTPKIFFCYCVQKNIFGVSRFLTTLSQCQNLYENQKNASICRKRFLSLKLCYSSKLYILRKIYIETLIIFLEFLICRYSLYLQAFAAFFITEDVLKVC